jgi:uncharacterized protein YndB with AHSA1/START domain
MTDRLERTMTVEAPIDRVWRAFADPAELCVWYVPRIAAFEARPGGRVEFPVPHAAGVVLGEVLVVDAPTLLTWREGPGLLPGPTEITVRLEAAGAGATTIHHTHAGLGTGPGWADEVQAHDVAWGHCLADLALYVETGVRARRAIRPKSRVGIVSLDVAAGLKVLDVLPGSFAARVGLRQGDLLIRLNGGSVFGRREQWFFGSEHLPDEQATAEWVRDGVVHGGSSTLDGPPAKQSGAHLWEGDPVT